MLKTQKKANNPNCISNVLQYYTCMISNWPMENFCQVPPLKKIQKSVFGDILTKSITAKILRRHPVACDKQAVSKL